MYHDSRHDLSGFLSFAQDRLGPEKPGIKASFEGRGIEDRVSSALQIIGEALQEGK